jgi:hypothetical protein
MSDPLDGLRGMTRPAPVETPGLAAYLEKVRGCAYTITAADVAALGEAGLTDDEIFEQTAAVAIEEGLRRMDAAGEAIG